MGLLHKKRKLSENDWGAMYECLFPEYIVRFTIYNNTVNRVECFFWKNDGYNNRLGPAICLRAFLKIDHPDKKPVRRMFQGVSKIGKGFDTFEDADEAWTKYYTSLQQLTTDVQVSSN